MLGCSGLNGELGLGGFPVVSYEGKGFLAGGEALIEAGFYERLASCLFMVGVMV